VGDLVDGIDVVLGPKEGGSDGSLVEGLIVLVVGCIVDGFLDGIDEVGRYEGSCDGFADALFVGLRVDGLMVDGQSVGTEV